MTCFKRLQDTTGLNGHFWYNRGVCLPSEAAEYILAEYVSAKPSLYVEPSV